MKKFIFLFILLPTALFSQIDYTYNLKNINSLNEDVVNLKIKNPSSDAIYILKAENSENVSSRMYTKAIPPQSGTTIRFKLNPKSKGRVLEIVKLYLSDRDKPITIQFNAKAISIPKNNLQECPSFGGKFEYNSSTGVYERANSGQFQTVVLNLNSPNNENTIDQTEVYTQNKTIKPKRDERLKREKREPKVNDRRNQPSLGQILFGKDESNDSIAEKKEAIKEPNIVRKDSNNLSNQYRANNIVFLLDASTSMKEMGKMELLKKSMITLLEPLRAKDYLSIVTYSGEADILMNPTSAFNKQEIEKTINSIEADGSTQAVKGIKKAIKVAKSNFIESGNNQILLVSDGAFDIGERNQSLRKQIEKEAKNGIIISTIGIKNDKWTNKSLIEISELGGGSFQRIKKEGDTNKLLEEVKQKALIR